MPKHLSLFGKYLRYVGKSSQKYFPLKQITRPIPPKAYGRPPSSSSQTGLYHDEDFNYHTKVSFSLRKTRRKLKPNVFKKDFHSEKLGTTVKNLRVTTSALHSMDDVGGFDEYILRTSPEELRSNTGEKMRDLMYYYMSRPDIKNWGLPWKILFRKRDQDDPYYARHMHYLRKTSCERELRKRVALFSPYYLPPVAGIYVERQANGSESPGSPPLNLWWKDKQNPALEVAFRRRLGEAKSFERRHPDPAIPGSFKTGNNKGGGGQSGTSTKKRKKTYKFSELRPY